MKSARNLARGLWIVWAVVVWNVVFDYVIVVAGREYLTAAIVAAHAGRYARMDDWMRPSVAWGLWMASAASSVILIVGFAAIRHATSKLTVTPGERQARRRPRPVPSSALNRP